LAYHDGLAATWYDLKALKQQAKLAGGASLSKRLLDNLKNGWPMRLFFAI
jgi:hypothetical protein